MEQVNYHVACVAGGFVGAGVKRRLALDERVEKPEFSKDEGRKSAPTLRDPEDDQLSEYNDDSSENDSDEFSVREEDGAFRDVRNEELGFLDAAPKTRTGRIVKTTNKALLWT